MDLDGILDAVDDLATAAKESLVGLTGDPVQKSGKPWADMIQASLLWGIDFDDVGEDMAQVPESEFATLREIHGERRNRLLGHVLSVS